MKMGYLFFYGIVAVTAGTWYFLVWHTSRGSSHLKYSNLLAIGVVGSPCVTAFLIMSWGYLRDGYLVEPARYAVIIIIVALPVSIICGIPFIIMGPKQFPDGTCRKCGYDLRGTTSGICPECGREISAWDRRAK